MMKKISGLALGLHPINIKTRPRQVSPFNEQLADFPEPPPSFNGRNSLIDKKTSDIPLQSNLSSILHNIHYE